MHVIGNTSTVCVMGAGRLPKGSKYMACMEERGAS